jgi:hypothetical protein
LADAGLSVDVGRIAQFTSNAQPPFQLAMYEVPAFGGSTEALRLLDRGHADQLPKLVLSSASSVPLSLIALAKEGVLPLTQGSADASEFPVAYRALDAHSDYLSARGAWLTANPTRWLNEVQGSTALFAWTAFPANGSIAPAVSRYFAALSGKSGGPCEVQVLAAHARASTNSADFMCDGADDLSRTLTEAGFAELRLSRFFATLEPDGAKVRLAFGEPRSPLLEATDFDDSGCVRQVSPPANAPSEPPDVRSSPPSSSPVVVSAPDEPYSEPTPVTTRGEGSSTVVVVGSNDSCSGDASSSDSSRDSCTGDASSSSSSSDSCSGDSSSSDSSSDSCSGDSSSDEAGPDSCSGDSSDSSSDSCSGNSDSSKDSGGCGKSGYDGDTCSGSASKASNGAERGASDKSAALGSGSTAAHRRPRQVRLSLLTLLAAALALPLRRLRASR